MRIGILSLVLHSNYGGILQSYALQTVLERMGHEVVVFNRPQQYEPTHWNDVPKRLLKKILGKEDVIFKEIKYKKEAPILCNKIWEFRKKYIHENIIDSLSEINADEFDALIVGSDQVWRPRYFTRQWNTSIENAFLAFTKDWTAKRVAYAASFGVETWEQSASETNKTREAIKMFDAISVREESGIRLLKENLGVDSIQVLDPTLLLEKEDYINLINFGDTYKSQGNLLTYILDNSEAKSAFVKRVSEEKHMLPYSVNNSNVKQSTPVEHRVLPSIEQWLRGFYDAEFVITDSFHACVFSIIFNKPFIALGNKQRGLSRFVSLLRKFGLEKNLIVDTTNYNPNIDFSIPATVYERLAELKKKSFDILIF